MLSRIFAASDLASSATCSFPLALGDGAPGGIAFDGDKDGLCGCAVGLGAGALAAAAPLKAGFGAGGAEELAPGTVAPNLGGGALPVASAGFCAPGSVDGLAVCEVWLVEALQP
jgi:hypothetical protein